MRLDEFQGWTDVTVEVGWQFLQVEDSLVAKVSVGSFIGFFHIIFLFLSSAWNDEETPEMKKERNNETKREKRGEPQHQFRLLLLLLLLLFFVLLGSRRKKSNRHHHHKIPQPRFLKDSWKILRQFLFEGSSTRSDSSGRPGDSFSLRFLRDSSASGFSVSPASPSLPTGEPSTPEPPTCQTSAIKVSFNSNSNSNSKFNFSSNFNWVVIERESWPDFDLIIDPGIVAIEGRHPQLQHAGLAPVNLDHSSSHAN